MYSMATGGKDDSFHSNMVQLKQVGDEVREILKHTWGI